MSVLLFDMYKYDILYCSFLILIINQITLSIFVFNIYLGTIYKNNHNSFQTVINICT